MNNQELISRLREAGQALETLAQHLNSIEDIAADIDSDIDSDSDSDPKGKASKSEEPKPHSNNANNNFNPFARLLGGAMSKPSANPFQLLSSLSSFAGLGGIGGIGSLASGLAGSGGGSGFIGGQSLPTTLAELHDNPQLLAMLRSVANNPQMLNMLSGITGQDSQTLLRALQSLQPQTAANSPANAEAVAAAEADVSLSENISEIKSKIKPEIEAENQPELEAAASQPQSLTAFAAELAAKSFEQNQQANLNQVNLGQAIFQQPMPTPAQTRAAAADIRMTTPQPAPADASYLDSLLAEWHWQPYARVWTPQS